MLEMRPLEVNLPDIQMYFELFKAVFNEPEVLTTRFLDWLYARNPVGPAFGLNAWSDGELAAHYAAIPVVYLVDGRKTKGLLALNTATHPKHQGKGIFTKIGNAANELAAERGFEFVSGVANQNSTDGYLRKLGFTLISPLEAKVGVGAVAAKEAPAVIRPFWDQPAFNWRLRNPNGRYSRHGGQVLADTGKFGIKAVLSLNTESLDPGPVPASAIPLRLWIGLNPGIRLRGLFVNVPRRFKTSPLNFIFKDLTGKLPRFDKREVAFELLDFDVY